VLLKCFAPLNVGWQARIYHKATKS